LQASEQLRVPIHRLVLDAYLVENERANGRFRDIRQFTTYYGLTSTFLIFLTLWVGWLVMRSLSLTERRHADQRQQLQDKHDMAEASARAKSRFLSSASHDLRQPAHALGLFVSQLTPMVAEPGAKHLVACANAAALDLQRMLDGLFDLSRLEAEATQIQIQNFALEDVFEQLRSGFAADASAKGLRLRVRHTRAWVRTDPVLLQRILLNLLGNALRYTEHGSVLVAARRSADAGSVRIEVRDSGIGIAPPDHENIFQEFYQVANAQRDRRNGLGLGLSIAQRCARLLDLPLSLRSDLGCGSCFTLSVPVVASQLEPEADDASQGLVPNELLGLHVLVIDDDPMGLEALAGLLASWGCVVTSAEGMQAALLHYSLEPWPDVIVTDYRMAEGHNGLDAIETLRAVSGKHIAACVVSGDTDPAVAQQVKTAGLVLLKKPVRPAKLRGLLRNLVRPR
jgi:signal transduction histidine kinase